MIKAVLFDYGGVLGTGKNVAGDDRGASELYLNGSSETDAKLGLRQHLFLGLLLITDRIIAGLYRWLPRLARKIELYIFSHMTPGFSFVRNESVRELAASLRQAGVHTGILSNVFEVIAIEHKRRGDYDGFDPVLLSCEAGLRKPNVKFYKLALEKLNLSAHEVLFIDDKKTGLIPARRLGMHTIHAKSQAQIVTDIRKLLKSENNLEF